MRLRDDHAFEQRKATISAILDALGPIREDDSGKLDTVRRFEVELDTSEPPLAALARFRYLEWWSRDGRGWRLSKYQYDYFDLVHGGRLAYHRHDLPVGADMLHSHCESSNKRPSTSHYRAYEVDLLEAHEEFTRLYASRGVIDCGGLRPLHVTLVGADA